MVFKKGMKAWNKGKTGVYSEEAKRKMSEAMKGRKFSEEHRRKLSEAGKGEKNPFYGKSHSEESKEKMSKSSKGRIPWNKGKTGL